MNFEELYNKVIKEDQQILNEKLENRLKAQAAGHRKAVGAMWRNLKKAFQAAKSGKTPDIESPKEIKNKEKMNYLLNNFNKNISKKIEEINQDLIKMFGENWKTECPLLYNNIEKLLNSLKKLNL